MRRSRSRSRSGQGQGIFVLPSSSLNPVFLRPVQEDFVSVVYPSTHLFSPCILEGTISPRTLLALHNVASREFQQHIQSCPLNSTAIHKGQGKKRTSFFPPLPSFPNYSFVSMCQCTCLWSVSDEDFGNGVRQRSGFRTSLWPRYTSVLRLPRGHEDSFDLSEWLWG